MLKIVGPWSLPSLPQKRVKTGVVSHDCCVDFRWLHSGVPQMSREILRLIARLRATRASAAGRGSDRKLRSERPQREGCAP
jgi:hypothetical protein